ncbi:hypothetical protein QYF36_014445 [Acer negundo]|nr:hypothetical protein QYF36_014445 [Acer negundo]
MLSESSGKGLKIGKRSSSNQVSCQQGSKESVQLDGDKRSMMLKVWGLKWGWKKRGGREGLGGVADFVCLFSCGDLGVGLVQLPST